ncbi:hypothetical protein ATANTOWER_032514 [Ataeniobius toweri]|uniref:Immunoglobulin V-set domain-containing protein n=1 Tax=Ataeniobius toweri TaxID=208326 RepID=A0ABU7AMC9_9TELE|nr:hypothetical protein [Ataeniobius toweri]
MTGTESLTEVNARWEGWVEITKKNNCTTINQTAYRAAKTSIRCNYSDLDQSKIKFICKADNYTCKEILTTQLSKRSKGRFSLTDISSGFDLSIRQVSLNDSGVYWCGVKEKDDSYRAGITKIQLKVKRRKSKRMSAHWKHHKQKYERQVYDEGQQNKPNHNSNIERSNSS